MMSIPTKDRRNYKIHFWLLKDTDHKILETLKQKAEDEFSLYEEGSIICRNCGNSITSIEKIVSIHGAHKHTFTNPAGVIYAIGCFSSAEGCVVFGEPTNAFTWFDSFRWSFASCSKCLLHLGWFYQRNDNSFFGLILDNLVETSKTN